jgi:hypothetical protein
VPIPRPVQRPAVCSMVPECGRRQSWGSLARPDSARAPDQTQRPGDPAASLPPRRGKRPPAARDPCRRLGATLDPTRASQRRPAFGLGRASVRRGRESRFARGRASQSSLAVRSAQRRRRRSRLPRKPAPSSATPRCPSELTSRFALLSCREFENAGPVIVDRAGFRELVKRAIGRHLQHLTARVEQQSRGGRSWPANRAGSAHAVAGITFTRWRA